MYRAGGHGTYQEGQWTSFGVGGHRPGADDMDEQHAAHKRSRPPASTISGFSAMRGRKKTNVARRSPSPTHTTANSMFSSGGGSGSSTSETSTIKYNTNDDGDGYQSSVRILDVLREMMTNQTRLNREFKQILDGNSIENNKALLALMVRQVLQPDDTSDETYDHAEFALSELDRDKLFRVIPDLEKTVLANQEHLYEFSIRDILVAFQLQHVDPTYLEMFVRFLINSACRTFMEEIHDENRSVRIGGLHAILTLFRVFYVRPLHPV